MSRIRELGLAQDKNFGENFLVSRELECEYSYAVRKRRAENHNPHIPMEDPKSFFASLFDFSFTSFITIKLIKFIYILALVGVALSALGLLGMGFSNGFTTGIISLIAAPIYALLMTMLVRVWMEMIIVMFRISDDVNKISKKP